MSSPTSSRPATARLVAPRPLVLAFALLALLAAGLTTVAVPGARTHAPVVRWSEPESVGTATASTATSSYYRFSSYVGGKPVRWNPCATIHWRFRTTYAPAGGYYYVRDAINRISLATGIRFRYDGPTTATPTSKWLPTSTSNIRPLLIGWTDGNHSDLLRGLPRGVLGVSRTAYFGATVDGRQVAATKAAVIALDRTDKLRMTGSVSWSAVLQHELAHAMGLDHVGNSRQLMYPMLQRNVYGLQYGDRLGLYRLGRSAGCISLPF
jgi:hypothetical protein